MPIPTEPDGPTWKVIAVGALGIAQLLFAWIASWILRGFREIQQFHGARITQLENTYVTRVELDRHVQRLEESGRRMHEDNKESLERIENKIDQGSLTRHDIRDSSHGTQTMLREILTRMRKEGKE